MERKAPILFLFAPVLLLACGGAEPQRPGDSGTVAPDASLMVDSGLDVDAGELGDSSTADAGELDAGPPPPNFAQDVAPILMFHCQGCHFVTDRPPRIFLEGEYLRMTYDGLVSQRARGSALSYVEAGEPERSYLLHKVLGSQRTVGGRGDPMPPPPSTEHVSPEEVATLRAWIEGGAEF